MRNFDYRDLPQPLRVFLCKPDNTFICELNGIEYESASLEEKLNNQYELEFDYYRYFENDGETVESNGYDGLLIGMKLFVENHGFFKMKYPPYTYDGQKESKHITASSIDVELEDKDLVSFKINTGEETSFEYLVEYGSNETEELLNPYTGVPYDYIVFYNTFSEQLTELKSKYSNSGTITDSDEIAELRSICNLIPRLVNKPKKDENGKIIQYIDENDNVMPAFDTYVIFNYNNDKTAILSITLTDFHDRIDELIVFYDRETGYGKQLSLLDLAIENCGTMWTIGDIDSSLVNKRCQFDIDGQNIYSFLTQDIAKQSNCIAKFDYVNYKINYIAIDNLGSDSGVIIDKQNLLNNLSIDVDEDNIVTRFNVSGGNDLNLLDVNFGSNRIVNIDYYLNARDKNGNRIYVSDMLATKYGKYKSDVELARDKYIEVAKQQRQAQKDIDEITYRVPNDIVQNDWGTFKLSELEAAETHYQSLLATLQTLYREDYPEGVNPDDSINETFIRTTPYWHDYYAYKEALTQIGYAQYAINNNTSYKELTDEEIIAEINAWETEWSLFGIKELENKIVAYNNGLNVMLDAKSVLPVIDNQGNPLTNKTILAWSGLSATQKAEYASESQYTIAYNEYMEILNNRNSCQTYLDSTLKPQLATLQQTYDSVTAQLNTIKTLVAVKTYSRADLHDIISAIPNEEVSFTDNEIAVIINLYVDHNYSNENILMTSIDDIVSVIDIEKELLEDAREQLSIESQPQFKFSTNIDNLLCMPEFKNYDFSVGNYILLQYSEGYYIQLRLDTIKYNPFIPEDSLNVTFTNYVKSSSKRNDVSYILGENSGSSSGSSGSGGGSGSGVFGESDKIDVTISNTMLAKLLNTEMFGSRVSNIILDTLKLNNLNAKHATFGSLASGTTTIDGACIETGSIISTGFNKNSSCKYNGTVENVTYNGEVIGRKYALDGTVGSVINLYDGTFSFGGGKLIFDGSNLSVSGAVTASTLSAGGKTSWNHNHSGLFINSNGDLYAGATQQTQINADGTFSFGCGKLTYDSSNGLIVNGNITATSGAISGNLIISGSLVHGRNKYSVTTRGVQSDTSWAVFYITEYTDTSRTTVSSYPFRVNGDGSLYASKATISGTITGTSGTIGGLNITTSSDTWNHRYSNTIYTISNNRTMAALKDGNNYNMTVDIQFGMKPITQDTELLLYEVFKLSSNGEWSNDNTNTAFSVNGRGHLSCSGITIYTDRTFEYDQGNINRFSAAAYTDEDCFRLRYVKFNSDAVMSSITVDSGDTYNLGTNSFRWKNVYCSAGAFNGSDTKLKNHIKYLSEEENIESFIKQLKPVMYTLKSGEGHRHHMGLYAQEVSQTAYNTIGDIAAYQAATISYDDDGHIIEGYYDPNADDKDLSWVMNYNELLAPTIAVLQKALNRIESLETRVQELEGE